jgi:hypothetical protein
LNIKFTAKPNWLLLIVSVVLFITVLLPWWSVSYMGLTFGSINGFHSVGILTFLASLAGIALSFLEISNAKYRAYGIIGIGVLALLGVIIAFTVYSGSSMGFGRIIALIVSIFMIVLGFLDYRGVDLWAKIKASSTKSKTPPPPPPPAPPAK